MINMYPDVLPVLFLFTSQSSVVSLKMKVGLLPFIFMRMR